jgi:hypothetical protein
MNGDEFIVVRAGGLILTGVAPTDAVTRARNEWRELQIAEAKARLVLAELREAEFEQAGLS